MEIPAWQRAGAQSKQSPSVAPADDPVYSQAQEGSKTIEAESREEPVSSPENEEPESVPSADTSPTTAPQAEEPAEKEQHVLQAEDFESFKQRQEPPPSQNTTPPPQPQERPPPIITYPEFLVEAHKPPPLVTPGRVLSALYAGGAVAAVLYGASKWLITPMVETLAESRHDMYSHTQTKLNEFNDRLSKIASKSPEPKSGTSAADDDDEASDASDPTELYHRDMGTQTSPVPSRRPSIGSAEVKRDLAMHAEETLKILRGHINELAEGSDRAGQTHRDRMQSVNNLRTYLDTLIYGDNGVPASWTQPDHAMSMKRNDDAIEELKKEIRGVKGVLLSAKRFPAVSRPVNAAA